MASKQRRGRSRRLRIGDVSVYRHRASWWTYFWENPEDRRRSLAGRRGDRPGQGPHELHRRRQEDGAWSVQGPEGVPPWMAVYKGTSV